MACDSVATVTSKLKADAGLVLDSEPAITAVGALLSETLGVKAPAVETYEYRDARCWYANGLQLTLSRNGNIQISASRYNVSQDEQNRILAALTQSIGQVSGLLAQAQAVLAIQAVFGSQITDMQVTDQRAAVITLSL